MKITRIAAAISLALFSAAARADYTTINFGLDRTTTPYNVGVNLSGVWSPIGKLTAGGIFGSATYYGATNPTSPLLYQWWMDTSSSPAALKMWDGAQWPFFAALDTAAHTWALKASSTADAGFHNATGALVVSGGASIAKSLNVGSATFTPNSSLVDALAYWPSDPFFKPIANIYFDTTNWDSGLRAPPSSYAYNPAGLYVHGTTGRYDKWYEYLGLFDLYNKTDAVLQTQNVALTGRIIIPPSTYLVGPSWGIYGDCIDNSGLLINPAVFSGCIGAEIDIHGGAGTDPLKYRNGLKVVASLADGVATGHVGSVIEVGGSGNGLTIDSIMHATTGLPVVTFVDGIDLSDVAITGKAFKSQGFSVDGSGNITIAPPSGASVTLNKCCSGAENVILGKQNGVTHWSMSIGDTKATTGTNAGSDFVINALSDTGSYLNTPLTIKRDTGEVKIGNVGNSLLTLNKQGSGYNNLLVATSGGLKRWSLNLGDGNETGANLGSDFTISALDDLGIYLSNPLKIQRSNGVVTFGAAPIIPLTGYMKGNGSGQTTASNTIPSADFADGNTGTGAVAHATSPTLTTPKLASSTVAGLPTCNAGAEGSIAYVTDASAPSYNATLSGGGAVKTLAMCNGANWTAH